MAEPAPAKTHGLASYRADWAAADPAAPLLEALCPPSIRTRTIALACLKHEITSIAASVREVSVAQLKLRWWHDELERLRDGSALHPLTQTLAAEAPAARLAKLDARALVGAELEALNAFIPQGAELIAARSQARGGPWVRLEAELGGHAMATADALGASLHQADEVLRLAGHLRMGRLPYASKLDIEAVRAASPPALAELRALLRELRVALIGALAAQRGCFLARADARLKVSQLGRALARPRSLIDGLRPHWGVFAVLRIWAMALRYREPSEP